MKRYCQTFGLYDNSELARAYVAEYQHAQPGTKTGIREAEILDIQVYIYEHILFMIVDTVDEFDWIKDGERLAKLPRRAEWEVHMSHLQRLLPGQTLHEKWKMMERIFKL